MSVIFGMLSGHFWDAFGTLPGHFRDTPRGFSDFVAAQMHPNEVLEGFSAQHEHFGLKTIGRFATHGCSFFQRNVAPFERQSAASLPCKSQRNLSCRHGAFMLSANSRLETKYARSSISFKTMQER